jgi:hypothetical protein
MMAPMTKLGEMKRKDVVRVLNERYFLRLLQLGPFERRARGWRFGTRVVSDRIVEHLIARGKAEIEGSFLRLKRKETA